MGRLILGFISEIPSVFRCGQKFWVFVLAVLCFASLSHAEIFPRPWEDSSWVATNPSIWSYGAEIWWNVPELHNTIDSIDNAQVLRLETDKDTAGFISKADESMRRAGQDKLICVSGVVASIGLFPLSWIASLPAAFAAIPSCADYRGAWISSVDNSLSALEASMKSAREAVDAARGSYDSVAFIGLCDSDYTLSGSESCAELAGAFTSLDNHIKEGRYGKYVLLMEYSARLKEGLAGHTPDLQYYPAMMGIVWGEEGTVASFSALRETAEKAKKDAEAGFQGMLKGASGRKAMAQTTVTGLGNERLDMIDRAPASFTVRKGGTVAERFKELVKREQAAAVSFEEAKSEHSRVMERGYLAAAMTGMADADQEYAALMADATALGDDAADAVEQQGEEAGEEISRTEKQFSASVPSQEASALYNQALEEFDSAENKGTLGQRFSAYSRAAALARAARSGGNYTDEAGALSSLAELERLIAEAEKDGINVAVEKENLALMKTLPPYDAEPYARSATDSIIAKARVKYEDGLLTARARIYSDLASAGPAAADLYTDAVRCDEDMFSDGSLALPEGIGKLAKLKSCYAALLEQLSAYKSEITGNSMSLTASPLTGDVELDKPAEITLDLVLANNRNYNATGVNVRVGMDSPWQFLYSDIISGKDGVESVRSEDGGRTLVLVFRSVAPFETKRVKFAKSAVLAHTLNLETRAEGFGNGAARVSETISFQLDTGISRLAVEDSGSVLVDGLPADRSLSVGKHTLTSDRTADDAYSETIANIRAYPLGMNSRVEYDVRIMPAMDLDSVPVLITSMNDSQISAFDVTCAAGGDIREERRVSGTQYGVKLAGLRKGQEAVLKVSYTAEGTGSFVAQEIERLATLNLSAGAGELLQQAKVQAESGNYTKALELVEKSKAAEKQEAGQAERLEKERDELAGAVRSELGEINSSLALANASGSPFVEKLRAREAELERVLAEAEAADLNGSLAVLGKADMKWLGKELAAVGKDSYAEYNDLKERFYLAGNTTTPGEFLEFEAALRKLQTGNRPEYAVEVVDALEKVRARVEAQEKSREGARAVMQELFMQVKGSVTDTLGRYAKQAAAAKGTEYSSLFQESERAVNTMLADAETALGKDERAFRGKLDELNRSEKRMSLTLDALENESEAKISLLSAVLAQKKLDDGKRAGFGRELDSMRSMAASGEYVNALRAGTALAKELDAVKEGDDSGLMVLGLTAFAILAAIGAYMLKAKKQEPKKLRKLPTAAEKPPLDDAEAGNADSKPPSGAESPV